jgi:ketosteroid isomerase-like protein
MKKLLMVLLMLCITSSALYSQDDSDLKAKFTAMNKEFAEMMVADDFQGMIKWYADDIISMPSYQPMLRGIDALKKADEIHKQSGVKTTAFTLETTDVIEADGYVIEIGAYTITMQIPGMDMPWTDNGKYMNVWESQDDGSYKMKVDTWNTDNNPWVDMNKEENHEKPVEKLETEDKK